MVAPPVMRHSALLPNEKAGALTLQAVGLLLGGMGLLFMVSSPDPPALWIAEMVMAVGLPAILIYAGYWIGNRDFSSGERWTLARWSLGGLLVTSFFGNWILLRQGLEGGIVAEPIFLLLSSAAVGSVSGLVAGGAHVASSSPRPSQRGGIRSSETGEPADTAPENARQTEARRDSEKLRASVVAELVAVLSDRRRLSVVEYLDDGGDSMVGLDELADYLVEEERTPGKAAGESRRDVAISLHHHHLPKMSDVGIVSYHRDSKTVRYRPAGGAYDSSAGTDTEERGRGRE